MIAWDKKTTEEAVAAGRRPDSVPNGVMPDSLIEIKPTGKTTGEVVREWHLWDHLMQDHDKAKANYGTISAHPELVDLNFGQDVVGGIAATPDGATLSLDRLRRQHAESAPPAESESAEPAQSTRWPRSRRAGTRQSRSDAIFTRWPTTPISINWSSAYTTSAKFGLSITAPPPPKRPATKEANRGLVAICCTAGAIRGPTDRAPMSISDCSRSITPVGFPRD